MLDRDIDGYLTFADVALGDRGAYQQKLKEVFDFYQSANETMTYTDFLVAIIDMNDELGSEVYEKCFEMVDVNCSTFITR